MVVGVKELAVQRLYRFEKSLGLMCGLRKCSQTKKKEKSRIKAWFKGHRKLLAEMQAADGYVCRAKAVPTEAEGLANEVPYVVTSSRSRNPVRETRLRKHASLRK